MKTTIIFLTTNRVPESWAEFHRKKLLEASGGCPIISVSCKPIDLGTNILQTEKLSKPNIFYQMLRAMRMVKTEFVAIAEDDTLYPKEHFEFIPDRNAFFYNQHRWSLYTWNPIYNLKNYIKTNATMIAPTKLALDLLEERFAKYPMGGEMPLGMCGELGVYEKGMGITPRPVIEFKTSSPVVQFDHDYFTVQNPEKESVERRHRKGMGDIKALSIPVWGSAEELNKNFK